MWGDKLHWYSEVRCYKVTGLYPPRLEDTNHEVLFTRAKKTQLYAKGTSD